MVREKWYNTARRAPKSRNSQGKKIVFVREKRGQKSKGGPRLRRLKSPELLRKRSALPRGRRVTQTERVRPRRGREVREIICLRHGPAEGKRENEPDCTGREAAGT